MSNRSVGGHSSETSPHPNDKNNNKNNMNGHTNWTTISFTQRLLLMESVTSSITQERKTGLKIVNDKLETWK
jgi:hypothetical protein